MTTEDYEVGYSEGADDLDDCRAELTEARAAIAKLREALEEISEGKGAYSMDPLKHASNCIEEAKRLASQALAATPSDCLKQIRAGVLDEAFAALPEENFKFVDRDKIKAVFEKLKQS